MMSDVYLSVFSFSQAQERGRAWFQRKAREQAGDFVPLDRAYTVADALVDYRADYQRRSGKATDRLDASAAAWIGPELGTVSLDRLTKGQIVGWHQKMAETPPRLRTKLGVAQRHREADASAEPVRRRRSSANRVLTILKAALNRHPFRSREVARAARALLDGDLGRKRARLSPRSRGRHLDR
jgi:hypothetical protein